MLSLIFWSMMIIVTLKYVTIIMRADNKGEGGSLALLALINRSTTARSDWTMASSCWACSRPRCSTATDDHAGDLGAVRGRGSDHGQPRLRALGDPAGISILVGLFAIQKRGTAKVGACCSGRSC